MGKGIKASKGKEAKLGRNFQLMEQAYREGHSKGMEKGYLQGKDDYLGLSNLLFQVATAKAFGWGPEEFEVLKVSINEITSDANERDVDVVELQKELQGFLESEDGIMALKAKYTEVALIKGIEDGLDNNEIMDRLDTARGSRNAINTRLNKLRIKHGALEINTASKDEFDLKLYDTVTRYGTWYRVTDIGVTCFTVTKTEGNKESVMIAKADYLSGKAGFIKRDLPEVKTYIDESLKNKPVEVTVAEIPAETVDDVTAVVGDDVVHAGLDADTDSLEGIDPAYSFDNAVLSSTDFQRRAELRFKADMDAYSSNVSRMKEKMEHGEIIDLADVTEYNRIVEKYAGVL